MKTKDDQRVSALERSIARLESLLAVAESRLAQTPSAADAMEISAMRGQLAHLRSMRDKP